MANRTQRRKSRKFRVRADAGERIRARRVELDIDQDELGRLAFGLEDKQAAKNAVSRMEHGKGTSPWRYVDAAGALGMRLTDVVEEVECEPPQ